MADAFENIVGQPKVREFLRASVVNGRVSHAYLFCGPAGSNKTEAAYALAQALLCPKGPAGPRGGQCGDCDACARIMRRKHPDVVQMEPEGVDGYLIDQIRDLVAEASLAPIQAKRRVFIIFDADRLGTKAANAFLKTLEEPPSDVVFILFARMREGVLPTIVSRCQVVPFRHIPASEAAGILAQNTGASLEKCRIAIESCGGSLSRAVEFLRSNETLAFRSRVLEAMGSLRDADDWDVIVLARDLVVSSKAPLDSVRAEQEEELAKNADFLAKSAIRQIEARNKRALSARTIESLRQLNSIAGSWLRDVLAICAETPELVINVDARAALEEAAASTDEARVAEALAAVRRSNEAISYNVSPETCIDALLFEVRRALYGPRPSARAHALPRK